MTFETDGTVVSGLGKGKEFVALEGYAEQFRTKLGYEPFPGTLNLEVDGSVHEQLADVASIRIDAWEDGERSFGVVDCYPATVKGNGMAETVPLHVIVPRRTDHDTSTLELISPMNLREQFDLSDGSRFEIRITSQ